MRTIAIIALLSFLLIGMAGATNPTPVYNFGPQGGINVPGVIETPYVTVDHDVAVAGDIAVTGSATIGGGYIEAGILQSDLTINDPYTLRLGTGAASVDFGRGTGCMKGVAGTTYLNSTAIKASQYLRGGGAVSANTLQVNNTEIVGGNVYIAGSGVTAGTQRAGYLNSNATLKVGTTATVNELRLNNSIYMAGNIQQGGSQRVTGSVYAGNVADNGTLKVTGLTSVGGIVLNGTAGITGTPTALTASDTKSWYTIDASAGDATVTLPAASTVTGRFYFITIGVDPGAYFARIKATSGTIMGIAAGTGLKNTDATGGIALFSDGTNYQVFGIWNSASGWVSG